MKVRALDTYKRLKLQESTLKRIPNPGEEFIVDDKRAKMLLGDNIFKQAFVEEVKEEVAELPKPKIEKAIKKNGKKC
jgi:hypothetical protein